MKFAKLLSLTAFALAVPASANTIIYQDDFSGDAGELNDETPDIGANNWVSSSLYSANGAVADQNTGDAAESMGSATLAFTPTTGFVYTLDASFRNFANVGTQSPDNDWIALGFANGQSALTGAGVRFAGSGNTGGEQVAGVAWMLMRGNTTGSANGASWLGADSPLHGTPSGGNTLWPSPVGAGFGSDMDMRIVLDTTGATWNATWLAKLSADATYTEVRSIANLNHEGITSVGIARGGVGFTADVTAFSLASVASVTTIYQDDFSGGAVALDGETPDIGANDWVSSSLYSANGAVAEPNDADTTLSMGSATLAFTPTIGSVYTLDASFSNFANVGSQDPDNDWIALGFANGQSALTGAGVRFAGSGNTGGEQVAGVAWMLMRGNTTGSVNGASWLGGDSPLHGTPNNGNTLWPSPIGAEHASDMDMRIVLDTTGATWNATWLAKLSADTTYTEVRSIADLNHEGITSVGIARGGVGFTANVTAFSLTSVSSAGSLPEITNIEIDGSGNVILTLDGQAEGLIVQRSNDLNGFTDVAAIAESNTLTIEVGDVDPNADGSDYFRVRK